MILKSGNLNNGSFPFCTFPLHKGKHPHFYPPQTHTDILNKEKISYTLFKTKKYHFHYVLNSYIFSSAPLISLRDHTIVITNASYSMLVSGTAIPTVGFQSSLVILVHFVSLVLLLLGP